MEESESKQEGSVAVKSRAIVKCQVGDPAVFSELQCDTNLNLPPANWLSEINKRYGIKFNSSSQKEFTSFKIASAFIEYMGDVDVVSDAENIKKLLKIPFSKSSVSMLVHRIGKTLLIDDFDICKHLVRAEETEWNWLSKHYQDVLREYDAKEKVLCRSSKSRDILQEKKLESKFFCHTIESGEETIPEFLRPKSVIPLPGIVSENQLQAQFGFKNEETEPETTFSGFSRNVEWTFEDIKMLVGSDMPIFGDSQKHPCVSLRLRDMNKPISVLTGMDYWLDNLMCNVPEVVMCCHLGGLVKNYELHKTEDLPKMKGSEFSPSVVRDVARNILTFLKSKATKAGHTYWLFRGKGDDVVKLYDLTSCCTEIMDDPSLNPVTVPLGILLYKVAINIYKSPAYRQQQGIVRTLITSCLPLLSPTKHLDFIVTALYILNDMYVPSDLDPASPNLAADDESGDYDEVEESSEEEDEESEKSFSIPVETLKAHAHLSNLREKCFKRITDSLEARCIQGLKYGIDALHRLLAKSESEASERANPASEGEPEMAKPYCPIPMPFETLTEAEKAGKIQKINLDIQLRNTLRVPVQKDQHFGWTDERKCSFLYKFILSYLTLAEVNFKAREFGLTLHNIRMAARVWELLESYRCWGKEDLECVMKLKTYALAVAGDAIYVVMQNWANDSAVQREAYNNAWNEVDNDILDVLDKMRSKEGIDRESSEDITFPSTLEAALDLSKSCYGRALLHAKCLPSFTIIKQRRKRQTQSSKEPDRKNDYDVQGLLRRLGNVHNDLGVYFMNLVTGKSEDGDASVQDLTKKSKECLKSGFEYFKQVGDMENMALLKSNYGRLLRLRSHFEKRKMDDEMSPKEVKYVLQAVDSYKEALNILSTRENNPAIWDAVRWELSTTLFNAACMLQENPPLSVKDRADVEREVASLFHSCLKNSISEEASARQPLYQYRAATVHHRLGAQYHSSVRSSDGSSASRSKFLQLAEKHYKIGTEMFLEMDLVSKYLSIQLERADLQIIQAQGDDHTRLKFLRGALTVFTRCHPAIRKVSQQDFSAKKSSEDESSEAQEINDVKIVLQTFLKNILQLLLQIVVCCKTIAQNGKKSKKRPPSGDLEMFKEAYQVFLKVDRNGDLVQNIDLALGNVLKLLSDGSNNG